MLDVDFTRQALDDMLAARDWYRAVSERLEERFRGGFVTADLAARRRAPTALPADPLSLRPRVSHRCGADPRRCAGALSAQACGLEEPALTAGPDSMS